MYVSDSDKINTETSTTKTVVTTTKAPTTPSGSEFKPTPSHKIDDSLEYCSEGENGFGSSRIVGGVYATQHSWPSIVNLRVKDGAGSDHQCGGTIIANHWVVTAAHC